MAKWKLCRQTYGNDTYEFSEGDEVTIGRGTQNTIVLQSLNISRKHCVISVKKDEVLIEDLKSANGIFVGLKKIAPNVPFSLSNNDVIGLGWTDGAPLAKVNDSEKFVFKLLKLSNNSSIIDRIKFQNEIVPQDIPTTVSNNSPKPPITKHTETSSKLSLKRKSSAQSPTSESTNTNNIINKNSECCNDFDYKKFKSNFVFEDIKEEPIIKMENEDNIRYEAFNIKQECFDDEVQVIDSDSDSEQWFIRLSQNSPRKSFTTFNETRKSGDFQQDCSYSQLDDDIIFVDTNAKSKDESDEELYEDDLFTILPPPVIPDGKTNDSVKESCSEMNKNCEHYFTSESTITCNESRKSVDQQSTFRQLHDGISVDTNEKNKSESDEEQYEDDLFTILPVFMPDHKVNDMRSEVKQKFENNLIPESSSSTSNASTNKELKPGESSKKREITTITSNPLANKEFKSSTVYETDAKNSDKFFKKIQFVDHEPHATKTSELGPKNKRRKRNNQKSQKSPSSKIHITNSQKEERKKKLREIATKDKGEIDLLNTSNRLKNDEISNTSKVNAKVTTSNRGAFLIDSEPVANIPAKRRKSHKSSNDAKMDEKSSKENDKMNSSKPAVNTEMKNDTLKLLEKTGIKNTLEERKPKENHKKSEHISRKQKFVRDKNIVVPNKSLSSSSTDITDSGTTTLHRRLSFNITKEAEHKRHSPPINEDNNENKKKNDNDKSHSVIISTEKCEALDKTNIQLNKDKITSDSKKMHNFQIPLQKTKKGIISSVKTILKPMKENMEPEKKSTKNVRFSDIAPEVREFEIEQGNQMKKTREVKTALLPVRHDMPVFSLQKIALMRVLRWNPQWLEEQNNFTEPPPILGHSNVPMAILHSFTSHTQYVEVIGDLLLMEIWECLTQGYVKTHNQNNYHQMRVESLPLVPPQRRGLDLINLNVNVSVPTVHANTVPREGEILMVHFGEDTKICRFFFVHNVRCLPSPPNNVNSFYTISLQTSFTEKIKTLQRGAVMYGKSLAYINKDLRLFEAMEYLSRSPLSEVILNPQPQHFVMDPADCKFNMESQWVKPLNESQRKAVTCAVSSAMRDQPRIHMVQGPPGTGKSRVICAIVMSYFYDVAGKKQKNRGKILICATSNAAVDELVLRLLDIRQSLPHPERLNMVRAGRADAMHPRARDISSLKLAQRDVARQQPDPAPGLTAEISLLEAKKNMWQTKALSTNDDARVAYCQDRVTEIMKKIAMFRSGAGAGGACAPELVAQAERRVLECADVVLTTLASAHSHKMRGLAGRIALCIVDEAGQAVEPESLVPLTLGVTRLALVGDPQQLPGFICSQRAKKHGLDKSLFYRLSSCAEAWGAGPVLLDRQYRMHPDIADYPNRAFYGGLVASEPPPPLALHTAPYFVLAINSGDDGQDPSGANDAEAWGAARVALALHSRLRGALPAAPAAPAHALAVITPYAAQRDLVRRHLRALLQAEGSSGAAEEVEVNTVDSFQGQERAVVVVSLARSHGPGFLAHAGRMNVMLTRARHALVLCLNPRALENNNQWRSLIEDAQKRNMFGILPIHLCQHPSVQNASSQEILQYLTCNPPVNNAVTTTHEPSKQRWNNKHRRRRASRVRHHHK